MLLALFLWQEGNAVLLFAVHHDFDGVGEADVAHVFRFLNGRQGVEHAGLHDAITRIGIDGEVTYAKRGEILEEVRALRGVYVVVLQSGFYDDASCGDVRPFHGDAQPVVAGAPSSRPDEHVVGACTVLLEVFAIQELPVDLLYLVGNLWVVGSRKVLVRLDLNHIDDIL